MKEKELNATIVSVEASIEKVNKTVEQFIPTVNVSAIQSLVAELSGSSLAEMVTTLTAKVTALETKNTELETKVTALETKVTSLETKDTELETKLATKCDSTKCAATGMCTL